jgi:hypothetical protein
MMIRVMRNALLVAPVHPLSEVGSGLGLVMLEAEPLLVVVGLFASLVEGYDVIDLSG